MKKFTSLLLALAMVFSLCACNTDTPVVTSEPTPTPTAEPGYKKVVTIGPNCTEIFCILGLQDRVIGKCMNNHSLGALPELKDAYDSIPVLCEGYPTVDEIKNSGCDFVFAYEWAFTDAFTKAELEKAGITVYVLDASTYDEIWDDILGVAEIFGVKDTAQSYIDDQKQRINAVELALSDIEEPLTVLVYDSYESSGYFYTIGKGNIEAAFIKSAGAVSVSASIDGKWGGLYYEDAAAAQPDYIIIHDYSGTTYDEKVKLLKTDPVLSRLDCVENERFIRISLENMMPGSRTAETVETIAYTLYPDVFSAAKSE